MKNKKTYSPESLLLDAEKEINNICEKLKKLLSIDFKRKGIVAGLSGGIDSSVTTALCIKALGRERVFGLLMPEQDSSDDTLEISRGLAEHFGIKYAHEDITPILTAAGCYKRRDEAIQKIIPEYGPGYKSKITLPGITNSESLRLFSIVAMAPDGRIIKERLNQEAYLGIVAATNFKQRVRKMLEYYYADKLNFAVAGTPNRLEYDQGFFVKLGDGTADVKPIAHLYKTQVYQLAEYLDIPEHIRKRPPTTDTYSMPQSQDEFYFSLPYREMDLCLYGKNNNVPLQEIAEAVKLTEEQTSRVFADIDQKRRTTRYLHLKPQLINNVNEIQN